MAPTHRQDKRTLGLTAWREVALDFLFPPRCAGCGSRGSWLCPDCRSSLVRLPDDACSLCGRRAASPFPSRAGGAGAAPSAAAGSALCPGCRAAYPALDGVCSAYAFEGALRAAIHKLKYRRARHLARPLGALLVESLARGGDALDLADVVAPVPLHPSRLRERGYNQSELLAAELASATGLPLSTRALRRVRPTQPQMALPAASRGVNVAGAFAVVGRELAGRRVLLVDDVCTTGSTLGACSVALERAGCAAVWGATLARVR